MLQCTQHTVVVDRGGDIVGRPFGRVDGVAQRHADTRMALAFVTPRMLMSAMSGLQRLDTHSGNSRMIRSSCSGDMKTHI